MSALGRQCPVADVAVPAHYRAQCVLSVFVGEVGTLAIVHTQERQSAQAVGVPCRQPEAVAMTVAVTCVLQCVHVVEVSALVAFGGMIGTHDVAVLVALVHLLVVVGVVEVVLRFSVHHPCAGAPAAVAVGEVEQLVVGVERAYTLYVLCSVALAPPWSCVHDYGTAQSAPRLRQRRSPVEERGLVHEVGGYGAEVHGAQHGGVNLHAIPEHLRMAGRCAPELGGRLRGAPVALDEEGGVLCQYVGHRECNVLVQHGGVKASLLDARIAQSAMGRHLHFVEVPGLLGRGTRKPQCQPNDCTGQNPHFCAFNLQLSIFNLQCPNYSRWQSPM